VSAKKKLIFSGNLLDEMISHCKEAYPLEACGILAGKDGAVQKIYRMTNIEHSSIRYQMDSGEQFRVMKEMRDQELEMVALYHSHPHSDAYPTPRDLRLAFYEEPFYVIVSLIHEKPNIKVFEIKDGFATEVALHI
jgi:proteasome lid subunit RPN8/RPN11